jgi:hypothetical protein
LAGRKPLNQVAFQRPNQRAADEARATGDEYPRIGKIIRFYILPAEHSGHDANQTGIQANGCLRQQCGILTEPQFYAAKQVNFQFSSFAV